MHFICFWINIITTIFDLIAPCINSCNRPSIHYPLHCSFSPKIELHCITSQHPPLLTFACDNYKYASLCCFSTLSSSSNTSNSTSKNWQSNYYWFFYLDIDCNTNKINRHSAKKKHTKSTTIHQIHQFRICNANVLIFPPADFTSPSGNAIYWWLSLFSSQKSVKKLNCLFGQLRCIHTAKTGYFGFKMTQKHENNEGILQNLSPRKGTRLKLVKIPHWPFQLIFLAIASLDNKGDFECLMKNWLSFVLWDILNQCRNVCDLWYW